MPRNLTAAEMEGYFTMNHARAMQSLATAAQKVGRRFSILVLLAALAFGGCTIEIGDHTPEVQPYVCTISYRCGFETPVVREFRYVATDLDSMESLAAALGLQDMHAGCRYGSGRWVRAACEIDEEAESW